MLKLVSYCTELVNGDIVLYFYTLCWVSIEWHKAVRWAKSKNGSKWWWQHWWRPGNCTLHIYCPSFETRQSGQYLLAPQRRPLPIGTNASGGVILCCLSIVNSHQASSSNGRRWNCLCARLIPGSRFSFVLFNCEILKMLNLYTAMSSVYVFQSCCTFSDWFSPYLRNSWSFAI